MSAPVVTLRLNAGDETRIMADTPDGQCLPLCDIKCGGMTGRTVAEGEAIAAGIVAAWNTRATAAEFAAREASLVETIVRDLALTKLANFEHASAEWLDGFGFAMERVMARAHSTSEAPDA